MADPITAFQQLRTLADNLSDRTNDYNAAIAAFSVAEAAKVKAFEEMELARRNYENFLLEFGITVRAAARDRRPVP